MHEVHGDRVSRAKGSMPSPDMVDGLADFFSIFGDRTRVKILLALDSGEMCVCDISETLDMSMSATSHQLRMLREAHLVSSRREGKNIFYSLCDDHVRVVLETALEHLSERGTKSAGRPSAARTDTFAEEWSAEFVAHRGGVCSPFNKMRALRISMGYEGWDRPRHDVLCSSKI